MSKIKKPLTELTFQGPRFDDHGLDLDILPELVAYKILLIETAKELWREQNPDRERLPRGFEDSITIKFYELQEGSTTIPLFREVEQRDDELPLELDDEIDKAIHLIEDGIESQQESRVLPAGFPKNSIQHFEAFGKTLRTNESIGIKSPARGQQVRYSLEIRDRLIHWHRENYEEQIELVGEVRATDLDGLNLTLRLDNGAKVSGKFDLDWEGDVVNALKGHKECRLRIIGIGEFSGESGELTKIQEIKEISIERLTDSASASDQTPIWEAIVAIGEDIPDEELSKLPTDLSKNLDKYIYDEDREGKK